MFLLVSLVLLFFCAFPSGTRAAQDFVETCDSDLFSQPASIFGDGATVFILAYDKSSIGFSAFADVLDEQWGDGIIVQVFDDGTGPGDIPDDGLYTGSFTIRFDGGSSGTITNNTLDILDLEDAGTANITVGIDGLPDNGSAIVEGDFSIPQVTINSGGGTFDNTYTLNATITDRNVDNTSVWYMVDGGPNIRLYLAGGNDFQSVVDTSGLPNGPHVIRVIAYDLAGNFNNAETVTIDVYHPPQPTPELGVTIDITPGNPKAGDTVTITATVENTGDGDATGITITYFIDTEIVDEETNQTIPAGETRVFQGTWVAEEGGKGARVEVTGPAMAPVTSLTRTFEVEPAGDLLDFLKNPVILTVIIVVIAVIMVGSTVGWAYLSRAAAKGKTPSTPVEDTTLPPEEKDPCEEIRRKWKAMVAEYESYLAEMEGAQRRAWNLRDGADEARARADKLRKEADSANESLAEGKTNLEMKKRNMQDFFAKGLMVDGISVGTPKTDEASQVGYFKGLVKVFFRSESYGQIVGNFVKENREAYDELQDDYDDLHKGMVKLESEAATANQMAVQAESEATAVESRASEAEREFENIKHMVKNLKEKSEAFRQKWRMCNLERLRETVEEAEEAVAEAERAARKAQDADSLSEFEEHKKKAEDAKGKADDTKGKSKKVKKKLVDEDAEEGIEELDNRMEKASSAIRLIVSNLAGVGAMFIPQASKLGKPCKGGETKTLNEYTMQYQFFDPTREITKPHFYEVQSGGEAGEAFADYVRNVSDICQKAKGVIGELPGGDLVGIPLEYWATIMDAGGAALREVSERAEALGYIKMSGLAIPTVQVTVTCQEIMVCREGIWQKERKRISETVPVQSQISFPRDTALPANEAIEWVQKRLETLGNQQRNYQDKPCG